MPFAKINSLVHALKKPPYQMKMLNACLGNFFGMATDLRQISSVQNGQCYSSYRQHLYHQTCKLLERDNLRLGQRISAWKSQYRLDIPLAFSFLGKSYRKLHHSWIHLMRIPISVKRSRKCLSYSVVTLIPKRSNLAILFFRDLQLANSKHPRIEF